MDNNKRL